MNQNEKIAEPKERSLSDKKSLFLRVELPIYSFSFNSMNNFVLAVSMTGVINAFPDVKESVLLYLLTITTLTAILGGFAFSFLSMKFSKKSLAIATLALGCICATLCLLFPENLALLFTASVGLGLAGGSVATGFPLLVNAHVGEAERSRIMGTGSGMVQFGRLTTFLLAGFLANLRWNYVYFVYIFMLISLLLILFLLPKDTAPTKREADAARAAAPKENMWLSLIKNVGALQIFGAALIFGVINFLSSSHISLYIEGYGLGLPSMTGILTAVSCLLAGITGLLFAPIYRLTGKRTYVVIFLLMGVGFVLAGTIISLPTILIGLAFCLVSTAIFLPYTLLCVFRVADDRTAPTITAMVPTLINAGSFLSPLILNAVASGLGDGSAADAYRFGGIIALAAGIIMLVFSKWSVIDRERLK
jgi:MFS family permease